MASWPTGLLIDLDRVPKKYDGLDGTELAISESQERMAVALAPEDVDEFLGYASEENLEATVVAHVTEEPRLRMSWRGKTIVDVSREFLSSNGAPKHAKAQVEAPTSWRPSWEGTTLAERLGSLVRDLNVASNKGLSERFDSTIGAATVLMPFGGRTQLTLPWPWLPSCPWRARPRPAPAWRGASTPTSPRQTPTRAPTWPWSSRSPSSWRRASATRTPTSRSRSTSRSSATSPSAGASRRRRCSASLMAQLDLGLAPSAARTRCPARFEDLDVPPTLVSFATAWATSTDRLARVQARTALA
ncbi:MAG: AIR synthase-related protein [Atopobiaceae bacterium]|nr:AIR synthase-related protein [Atopobiaceae bacterium]